MKRLGGKLRVSAEIVTVQGRGLVRLDQGPPGLIAAEGATAALEVQAFVQDLKPHVIPHKRVPIRPVIPGRSVGAARRPTWVGAPYVRLEA